MQIGVLCGALMQHTRRSMESTADNSEPRAAIQIRLAGPLYRALENWRRSQPKIPARSKALRELLERALAEHQPDAG
jgi:hypothetical protein